MHRFPFSKKDAISIRGARVHNLKNIDLRIPKHQFVVLSGPSGSGKSSLAFDLIYLEGQRRYLESLAHSNPAFLFSFQKPDVDTIKGLSPTVAISQQGRVFSPRSTVGTFTDIYSFLRLLWTHGSTPFCTNCKKPLTSHSVSQLVQTLTPIIGNKKAALLAPVVKNKSGEHLKLLSKLFSLGFYKIRIDGKDYDLNQPMKLNKKKKINISVYIDHFYKSLHTKNFETRLERSLRKAIDLGQGMFSLFFPEEKNLKKKERMFSKAFFCPDCQLYFSPPTPALFTFNSPTGACSSCHGLGTQTQMKETQDLFPELLIDTDTVLGQNPCSYCQGTRLQPQSAVHKIQGQNMGMDIGRFSLLTLEQGLSQLKKFSFPKNRLPLIQPILKELFSRLELCIQLGIGYLTFHRNMWSLSGGETQRLKLCAQIASPLMGVCYVLDEPSAGLHAQDHLKLLNALKTLRDRGNSILVVEHDRETLLASDWILDLGPGAGKHGGGVVFEGSPQKLIQTQKGLTGDYLSKKKSIPIPRKKRVPKKNFFLKLKGARKHNLKNIDVSFPLGLFIAVTGVSGSGKSTLLFETLYPAFQQRIKKTNEKKEKISKNLLLKSIEIPKGVSRMLQVHQSPIGKTPRSNPATYLGIFQWIRTVFSKLKDSHLRGFKASHFSFNVKGGRCETCHGAGIRKFQIPFLPIVFQTCETCEGKRYLPEILEPKWKEKSIADVLQMTVEEAYELFQNIPPLKQRLKTLIDIGLGYLALGQSSPTLSGGESQRLKLAKELSKTHAEPTIFLFDEPTTGLHFHDIVCLLNVFQSLVDQGHTIIFIEHHLELIACADWVIDLGTGGGPEGGKVLFEGTPEELSKISKSATGRCLKKIFQNK